MKADGGLVVEKLDEIWHVQCKRGQSTERKVDLIFLIPYHIPWYVGLFIVAILGQ